MHYNCYIVRKSLPNLLSCSTRAPIDDELISSKFLNKVKHLPFLITKFCPSLWPWQLVSPAKASNEAHGYKVILCQVEYCLMLEGECAELITEHLLNH